MTHLFLTAPIAQKLWGSLFIVHVSTLQECVYSNLFTHCGSLMGHLKYKGYEKHPCTSYVGIVEKKKCTHA